MRYGFIVIRIITLDLAEIFSKLRSMTRQVFATKSSELSSSQKHIEMKLKAVYIVKQKETLHLINFFFTFTLPNYLVILISREAVRNPNFSISRAH